MSLDPPRHLYLHSLKSIQLITTQAGLKIVEHFFDMEAFSLMGSEQYRLGLTLFGPGSYIRDREHSPITDIQWKAWEQEAAELNANGTADQATFILKKRA